MDSDETSSSQATKSHSSDEYGEGRSVQDMLMRDVYQSKEDIIDAAQDYHARALRNFKVVVSDKRRYKVVCTVEGCGFVAQFAFKPSFKRPSKLSPHTCPSDLIIEGRRRFCTATVLVRHPELREYFLGFGRKVSPILFKRKAEELGLFPTYMNCVNACKKLVEEVFGSDSTQYQCIPSYVEELN